jgi:protein phosphatase
MNITIERPFAATDKGKRANNEDFIYPLSELASSEQRLFLVCDGVGGAEKGEIASALACESFQTYFNTFLESDLPDEDFINKATQYTESCFDEYVDSHPEATGMATTMTLLYIGTSGVVVAHVGDSRIYHFRKNEILFQTEDHSLVNSLVKLGKITKEEVETYPSRNVITRAIEGSLNPTIADINVIRDIEAGDTFLMCSDGVVEHLSDKELCNIFLWNRNAESIKDALVEHCSEKSNDNFSFYVIPVLSTQNNSSYKQNILSFFYFFV